MDQKLRNAALLEIALALAVWAALFFNKPPEPLPATASNEVFSAARAEVHLREIARMPHPSGTAEHARVAAYLEKTLTDLGLTVEVHEGFGFNPTPWGSIFGSVHNILGRIKGRDGQHAVMLMAHYDSTYTAPGAADDGAAVAALLETARALKSGPQPFHDILFLLTDNEEGGMLGARAFVKNYPCLDELLYVFNFEARGNGGPSLMFETTPGNEAMVAGLQEAVPYPFANSLASAIYDHMSNDTDFTLFKDMPLQGMNFAFIGGVTHYHSMLDSIDYLDRGSLQHQGSYALGVARYFGNLETPPSSSGNAVYFNLIGSVFVRYGSIFVWPLCLLTLFFWAFVWYSLRRKELVTFWKTVKGVLSVILILLAPPLAGIIAWIIVAKIHSQFRFMVMHPYNGGVYLLAFCLLGLAAVTWLVNLFGRRLGLWNLALGALLIPMTLLVVLCLYLPGGTWFLQWPLLLALLTCFVQARSEPESFKWLAAGSVGMIGIWLIVPLAYHVYGAFPMELIAASMLLFSLLMLMLIPQITVDYSAWRSWGAVLSAVLILVVIGTQAGFTERHPEPVSIFYGLDKDSGNAYLATVNQDLSPTERRYLGDTPERGEMDGIVMHGSPLYRVPAPAMAFEGPEVHEVSRTEVGSKIVLELEGKIQREAWGYRMRAKSDNGLSDVCFNDQPVKVVEQGCFIVYRGDTRNSFKLRATIAKGDSLKLDVVDEASLLPPIPGLPEHIPASAIPSPFGGLAGSFQFTNHVHRSFVF